VRTGRCDSGRCATAYFRNSSTHILSLLYCTLLYRLDRSDTVRGCLSAVGQLLLRLIDGQGWTRDGRRVSPHLIMPSSVQCVLSFSPALTPSGKGRIYITQPTEPSKQREREQVIRIGRGSRGTREMRKDGQAHTIQPDVRLGEWGTLRFALAIQW
jgi:hypothetical protein